MEATALVLAVPIVGVLLYGTINIIGGGFFFFTVGALGCGMALSIILSAAANLVLMTLAEYEVRMTIPVVFMKSWIAAVAQPTLTSIVCLALLSLVALAAAKVGDMIEEVNILVDSHVAFTQRETPSPSPPKKRS